MSTTFQINRKVRDAVILNLRRVFTGDPKYPYVETVAGEYDFDNTKIVISDVIPEEDAFYPIIVVNTVSGPEQRYLGPDDLRETKDTSFLSQTDEIFASINLTVNIQVFTIGDTIARDELMDRLYDQFKLITDDLADNGIEIKRTTFLPDQRVFINDRWALTGGISLEVYSEWVDDKGVTDRVVSIPITLELDLAP